MDLEVRHLQLVSAVADEGSLTRAAERLHLTQSALSHQLLDIERRLGLALFHRVSKRMILTQAGERLLSSARRILDELQKTEDEVRLFADNRRGVLRFTTECYTCYHWLPVLMKRFQMRHPAIELFIDVESTDTPIEALLAGRIDLALITDDVKDKRIETRPLFTDEMVLIAAPEHRLASRPYVTAKEIAAETLLMYAEPGDSTVYRRLFRPAGLMPARWMRVQLTEAIVEMVRNGIGVSVMARWMVAPQIASKAVAEVPVTKRGLWRDWRAAMLRSSARPGYLDDFIAMLAKESPKRREVPLYLPPAIRKKLA